ncbi:hypothetical protein BC941DRAFT_437166, partial [Chlamydoabsidia padenii]
MRTHHTHLTQAELALLEEQYWASPYGKRQQKYQLNNEFNSSPQPTKLAVFDFDSTLFLSPLFSGNLWDSWFVNAATTENLIGPGFWRDIRSLILDNTDTITSTTATDAAQNLVKSAWKGWWNEDVVVEARRAIEDSLTLAVVLTGRRVHPFANLIKQMLTSKNLHFDILGLRPDPPTTATTNSNIHHLLDFNEIPDTFMTTMDFKLCFILHLRSKVKTLQDIVMWDDRPSHLPVFEKYVATLVQQGYFKQGSVKSVVAVRPRYNEKWEINLVNKMVESHNHALEQTKDRPVSPVSVVVDDKGNMVNSYDFIKLVRKPSISVLRLVPSSVIKVQDTFGLFYQHHHQTLEQLQPTWQYLYGEQPVFFGDIVLDTSTTKSTLGRIKKTGDSTQQVDLVVVGWHIGETASNDINVVPVDHGLTLSVWIDGMNEHGDRLILPLWYRPSTFQKLTTQSYQWSQSPEKYYGLRLTAYLDYVYMYGIEKMEPPGHL